MNKPKNLQFIVTTDNPQLFSVAPTISSTGTLSFQSAANATGIATVTVKVKDDGGTANGGIDTSGIQTFTIDVRSLQPYLRSIPISLISMH